MALNSRTVSKAVLFGLPALIFLACASGADDGNDSAKSGTSQASGPKQVKVPLEKQDDNETYTVGKKATVRNGLSTFNGLVEGEKAAMVTFRAEQEYLGGERRDHSFGGFIRLKGGAKVNCQEDGDWQWVDDDPMEMTCERVVRLADVEKVVITSDVDY